MSESNHELENHELRAVCRKASEELWPSRCVKCGQEEGSPTSCEGCSQQAHRDLCEKLSTIGESDVPETTVTPEQYYALLTARDARNAELRERLAEMEASFDLFHRCSVRATMMYKAAHPEMPDLQYPDGAVCQVWLMEEIDRLKKERKD